MSNVSAGYGRFSDLIAFLGIFIHYNMFKSFTDCVLRHKCRGEKQTYVNMHGYVSLSFSK